MMMIRNLLARTQTSIKTGRARIKKELTESEPLAIFPFAGEEPSIKLVSEDILNRERGSSE